MLNLLLIVLLVVFLIPTAYLTTLALSASRKPPDWRNIAVKKNRRFLIAIAAHDEAPVIENTVLNLYKQDYPSELFVVAVVADHCTDNTASLAAKAGAVVYERNLGSRSGKGAALSWLFNQILIRDVNIDAVVILDADTFVDHLFLRVMNARLESGDQVIQGKHIIANPQSGWFPLLTWAMFIIDNRFQNQGRVNLGWSAKHMGDSICFRMDILRQVEYGLGLTEDYDLRQKLLLCGVRISYEPAAIGYGEAPKSWTIAQRQRIRWLRGSSDSNKSNAMVLLRHGIKMRDGAMIDGALQGLLPAYSTVTLAEIAVLMAVLVLRSHFDQTILPGIIFFWFMASVFLFLYPFWGLALERAPLKAYLVILTGPVFILWRSWLALKARFFKQVVWIRTPHGV